ncbi:MAG: hypothetical protein AAF471_04560, partial [Myxococcota bacterium]
KAVGHVERIEEGVESTDYDDILGGLHSLRLIDLMKISQPDAVMRPLLQVYSHPNILTLNVGFKYQIAKQVKRFTRALFAINHRSEKPVAFEKDVRKDWLELLGPALSPVDEETQPSAGLRYELECARAGIGALSDGNSFWDDAKEEGAEVLVELVKGLADGGISALAFDIEGVVDSAKELLQEIALEKAKQAFDFATRKFRGGWYNEVLLIDYLGQCMLGNSPEAAACAEALDERLKHHTPNKKGDDVADEKEETTQRTRQKSSGNLFSKGYKWTRNKTKKAATKLRQGGKKLGQKIAQSAKSGKDQLQGRYKWQVLYAALETYARVAWSSTDGKRQQQALETLARYADFDLFAWQNNWRVREKAAQGLILLTRHKNERIVRKATLILAERQRQETDERVRVMLTQPQYVTVLEQAILEASQEKSSPWQSALATQKEELLEAMKQQLREFNEGNAETYQQEMRRLQDKMRQQQTLLVDIHQALTARDQQEIKETFAQNREAVLTDLLQQLDQLQQQARLGDEQAARQAIELDKKLTRLEGGQAKMEEIEAVLTAHKQRTQLQLRQMLQGIGQMHGDVQFISDTVQDMRGELQNQGLLLQDVEKHVRQMNANLNELGGNVENIQHMVADVHRALGSRLPMKFKQALSRLHAVSQQELQEDVVASRGMDLYIPLQGSNRPIKDLSRLDRQQQNTRARQDGKEEEDDDHEDGKEDEKQVVADTDAGASDGSKLYDLHEHVLHFLENRTNRLLLLQGNAGSGKSLYGRYLERVVWDDYHGIKDVYKGKHIPVFISLPKAYNPQQPDKNIIESALAQKGLNAATIAMLKQRAQQDRSFLFILDSYDEIEAKVNLYQKYRLREWGKNSQFIVSSRVGYVQDTEAGRLFDDGGTADFLTRAYIAPFSKQLIDDYIVKFQADTRFNTVRWPADLYRKSMAHFAGLNEMARDPFAVNLILSTLPQLVEQHAASSKRVTRTQLYDAFSQQHFDREMGKAGKQTIFKLQQLRNQAEEYAEDLAFTMFVKDTQVAIAPHRRNVNGWNKFFDEENQHLMRCNPIKGTGGDRCSFSHKSFQEYFAAQKLVNEILYYKKPQDFNSHLAQQGASYAINQKNLNDAPAIINFIIERMKEKGRYSMLQERLFHIIHASKVNADVATASANAMTILNTAGIPFSYKNLQNIRAPQALLHGAMLDSVPRRSGAVEENVPSRSRPERKNESLVDPRALAGRFC